MIYLLFLGCYAPQDECLCGIRRGIQIINSPRLLQNFGFTRTSIDKYNILNENCIFFSESLQGIGVYFFESPMGAFLRTPVRKNRAFRSNSAGLAPQFLRDFRCNPLRGRKV
jgi:hypothetical protein